MLETSSMPRFVPLVNDAFEPTGFQWIANPAISNSLPRTTKLG
jgi:hypothetical protein